MDEFINEELIQNAKKLMELYDIIYEELKNKVKYIINKKITDENIIEHMLDDIVNIPTEKCNQLFLYFCQYVSLFNKEVVNNYIDLYNDLYGPIDKDKILKKN